MVGVGGTLEVLANTSNGPLPKKMKWTCKVVLAGPRATPYTASECAALQSSDDLANPNRFSGTPGPQTGGYYESGPIPVAWWPSEDDIPPYHPEHTRDPDPPTVTNKVINGQNYAGYFYAYYSEQVEDSEN